MIFFREREALKARGNFYVICRPCFVLVCSTMNIIASYSNRPVFSVVNQPSVFNWPLWKNICKSNQCVQAAIVPSKRL